MVNIDKYFCVWKQRLEDLKIGLSEIKSLPKEAHFRQAIAVRNACLKFIKELEEASEEIVTDHTKRKEELFLDEVDVIRLAAFNKRPYPFDIDLRERLMEQKRALTKDGKDWAIETVEFERNVERVRDIYIGVVHWILGELAVAYNVSPRIKKRR